VARLKRQAIFFSRNLSGRGFLDSGTASFFGCQPGQSLMTASLVFVRSHLPQLRFLPSNYKFNQAQIIKSALLKNFIFDSPENEECEKTRLSNGMIYLASSFINYLPFALVVWADLSPLFAEVLALLFDADDALFVFDDAEPLAVFEVFAAPLDLALPPDAPLPPFAFVPDDFSPPSLSSSKSPTASATTLSVLSAAPVAAPVRISPATSVTLSKIGDDCFFVDFLAVDFDLSEAFAADFDFTGDDDFFAVPLFDFSELDFAEVDFAGAAFFAVDF
jgi:hypothetical protein